jgi:hypothetical protein
VPLDLSADELATAAQACRAMAYQEGERAKRMENVDLPLPRQRGKRCRQEKPVASRPT